MGEYVVPLPADATDGKVQLVAANMVNGITIATLTWFVGENLDARDFAHRVAFSVTGQKLWQRTDNDNHNNGIDYGKKVLPALLATSMPVTSSVVVFGVDDQYVGVDVASGKERYRAKGPYSGGVSVQGTAVFGVDAYSAGGYGNGVSVFRTADGTFFGVTSAATVAEDPLSGLVAVGYTITDSGLANDAPNTPGTPAIQVLNADGTAKLTVKREQAASLGQPKIVRAFDGRMIVAIKDGIRVIKMADGTSDAGFE